MLRPYDHDETFDLSQAFDADGNPAPDPCSLCRGAGVARMWGVDETCERCGGSGHAPAAPETPEPVPGPALPMSEGTVRKLAALEYQFVRLDADLDAVRDQLRQAAREAPRCTVAAKQVQALRRMLRRVLSALDEDVTAAVAALERMPDPPF
jgi:hypothetical protein